MCACLCVCGMCYFGWFAVCRLAKRQKKLNMVLGTKWFPKIFCPIFLLAYCPSALLVLAVKCSIC